MPTASSRTTASRSSWPGPELQALAEAALALARRVPSGRIALARTEEILGKTTVHEPLDATTVQRASRRLDEVDPEPLAVRAAAQTHRGVVDCRPVAIRIRRPGLERMARNDLALLDALALPLSAALPQVDAGVLLRSAREQLLDELDFEHEASMHRRVARIRAMWGAVRAWGVAVSRPARSARPSGRGPWPPRPRGPWAGPS